MINILLVLLLLIIKLPVESIGRFACDIYNNPAVNMIFAVGRGMLEIGFRPIFSYRSDCLT